MLSKRQMTIISLLEQEKNCYVSGSSLANKVGCSLKTLQSDIKGMKDHIQEAGFQINSLTSKGYRLQVLDAAQFLTWKHTWNRNGQSDFNDVQTRVTYLLNRLLSQEGYCKLEELADEMFVSRASAALDLKQVRNILQQYHLTIKQRPKYGIQVVGSEKDKRSCIVKQRLPFIHATNMEEGEEKRQKINQISDIVAETLMQAHYKISDIVFQNLILHIYVAIYRMKHQKYLQTQPLIACAHEVLLARNILVHLQEHEDFIISESEVQHLALHLQGKRSYEQDELINANTTQLVDEILDLIYVKLGIALQSDVELRISLALHLVPLLSRLKLNMQLENHMVKEIKQHFPLAYDMATLASTCFVNTQSSELSQDEIAYLAIHFNLALQKVSVKQDPKRVLIICNSRRGDSLLLQHVFYKHFAQMIEELNIINANEVPFYKLDHYDCIFATFLNHDNIPKQAIRINFFLEDSDLARIARALKGEQEISELLKYFDPSLFFNQLQGDKKVVLKHLCTALEQQLTCQEDLYEAVLKRETLGFTAFGNGVAVPHPEALIASRTMVAVAVLPQSIDWGDQRVQLIFLVCVAAGNQQDLRSLFECISQLIMDQDSIDVILHHHDYDTLIRKLASIFP